MRVEVFRGSVMLELLLHVKENKGKRRKTEETAGLSADSLFQIAFVCETVYGALFFFVTGNTVKNSCIMFCAVSFINCK